MQAAAPGAQPAFFQCAGVPRMGCAAQGIDACADAAHRPEQLLGVQHARHDRPRKVEGVDGPRRVPRVIELKRRPEVDAVLHSQQRIMFLTARMPCFCATCAGDFKKSRRLLAQTCDASIPYQLHLLILLIVNKPSRVIDKPLASTPSASYSVQGLKRALTTFRDPITCATNTGEYSAIASIPRKSGCALGLTLFCHYSGPGDLHGMHLHARQALLKHNFSAHSGGISCARSRGSPVQQPIRW